MTLTNDWAKVVKGDRIALVEMPNDPDPIPVGTRGWVTEVVESGGECIQLWVNWDIDRSLCLVPGDVVRVLSFIDRESEQELELERDRIRDTRQFFPPRPRTREERATILGSHLWERR